MNGRIKRFKAYNEVTRKRWKSYKQQMYPIVIRRNYSHNFKSKTHRCDIFSIFDLGIKKLNRKVEKEELFDDEINNFRRRGIDKSLIVCARTHGDPVF